MARPYERRRWLQAVFIIGCILVLVQWTTICHAQQICGHSHSIRGFSTMPTSANGTPVWRQVYLRSCMEGARFLADVHRQTASLSAGCLAVGAGWCGMTGRGSGQRAFDKHGIAQLSRRRQAAGGQARDASSEWDSGSGDYRCARPTPTCSWRPQRVSAQSATALAHSLLLSGSRLPSRVAASPRRHGPAQRSLPSVVFLHPTGGLGDLVPALDQHQRPNWHSMPAAELRAALAQAASAASHSSRSRVRTLRFTSNQQQLMQHAYRRHMQQQTMSSVPSSTPGFCCRNSAPKHGSTLHPTVADAAVSRFAGATAGA